MKLSQKINRFFQRTLSFLVDDIRLSHYGFIFIFVILLLSIAYYLLTPSANGIGRSGNPISDLHFGDAIYFSIVTVSSLGYGDMHPMGFAKLLASIEVLFGLSIIGIILAKLTSSRLSHHVSRLYTSELQKRLQEFSLDFEQIKVELQSSMRDLGRAFQQTPEGASASQGEPSQLIQNCSLLLIRFRTESQNFNNYIHEETYKGAFFEIAPQSAFKKTAETIDNCLFVLAQLVTSLSPETKTIVLDVQNRKETSAIVESSKELAEFVINHARHDEIRKPFSQLLQSALKVPESFYSVPGLSEENQPDQIFDNENEPE